MGIVSVNLKKNRIYITITGTNREELELTVNKIEVAALELRLNFTCLSDFRYDGSLLIENRDLFERGQEILKEMGIGKAVWLATERQIESHQFQILDIVRSGYEIEYATCPKSAERILDNYKREVDQVKKQTKRGNSAFKIINKSGWEVEHKFIKYKDALKRLKQIRKSGRTDAIIVSG
jgi:hypothetical protein